MSEVTIDLVDRLVRRVPALEPLLREHLADNFGEVLPHLFFGELTRYVVSELGGAGDDPRTQERKAALQTLLDELEEGFANGGEEVAELICVSFLENLPRKGEEGDVVRDLLGPRLKSELKRIG